MYVKLSLGDLNPGLYPPHLINTYTYEVIIASRVYSGEFSNIWEEVATKKY